MIGESEMSLWVRLLAVAWVSGAVVAQSLPYELLQDMAFGTKTATQETSRRWAVVRVTRPFGKDSQFVVEGNQGHEGVVSFQEALVCFSCELSRDDGDARLRRFEVLSKQVSLKTTERVSKERLDSLFGLIFDAFRGSVHRIGGSCCRDTKAGDVAIVLDPTVYEVTIGSDQDEMRIAVPGPAQIVDGPTPAKRLEVLVRMLGRSAKRAK